MFKAQKNDYIDYYLSALDSVRRLKSQMATLPKDRIDPLKRKLDTNMAAYEDSADILKKHFGFTGDQLANEEFMLKAKDRARPCSVAFVAAKGGPGKTTLAVNLATILAFKGWKVLLVDIDEQCNATLNVGLRLEEITKVRRSCRELFNPSLQDMEGMTLKPIPELPTLDLIPSTFLLMYQERELIYLMRDEPMLEARILTRNMLKFKDFFDQYDYVIFDTKPSLSQINENCFASLDTLIAVTDPGYNSLTGLSTLMGYWDKVARDIRLVTPYNECIALNKLQSANIDKEIYALLTGKKDYTDSRGNVIPIDPTMLQYFGEYYTLFIDPPIKHRSAIREREKIALPLVVNTTYQEREALKMFMDFTDALFEKGLLRINGGND